MLTLRTATEADEPALAELMTLAIDRLQDAFLRPAQVHASHQVMGLDTELLRDSTYFLVETAQRAVGCGGWSRRATLYGGAMPAAGTRPCSTRRAIPRGCGPCTPTPNSRGAASAA